MTIADFLLSRIAEDEAAIERRGASPHSTHGSDAYGAFSESCPDCRGLPGRSRVLAECAAKRATVQYLAGLSFDRKRDAETAAQYRSVLWIAQGMARVYADHPDYLPEWSA